MMESYSYWEIQYVSCEGNNRWTIARAPEDWDAEQVRERIPMGGCGDDVDEVTDVFSSCKEKYEWDFTI